MSRKTHNKRCPEEPPQAPLALSVQKVQHDMLTPRTELLRSQRAGNQALLNVQGGERYGYSWFCCFGDYRVYSLCGIRLLCLRASGDSNAAHRAACAGGA